MKHLLCLFLCTVTFSAANAQTQLQSSQQIYIQIDSFRTDLKLLIINPDKIESVDVLKGEHATSKYGTKATDGAVIIKTKLFFCNIHLLRIFLSWGQYY